MPVRLFVGNLPYDTTEADLRELFSAVGPLSYVYLPTDKESGKPRGFAFVEFNDAAHAAEAIRRFNNQMFKSRPLAVNEARAKESRPVSGFRPQSGGPPMRPASPRPGWNAEPDVIEPPARGGAVNRNFGPDAAPRRARKQPSRAPKAERGPKGPIPERVRGRFFADDTDENDDDLSGENFASSVTDPDSEGDE